MKNRYQLRQYIRFQLEQMSARNQHHQFEELAFELARQTVSRRLVSATGPVQAGGDHGRDFESYHSYLAGSKIASSVGAGIEKDEVLVFGCTLNKNLAPKIKADIGTMCGAAPKPARIYYYAVPDLPVAKRHKLQAWSREQHCAQLEVFDGQAIANLLAEPAHFWIAEQFLGVPADMFPPVETDAEYGRLKDRWFGGDREISNFSDLMEVKRGLRKATLNGDLKPHLGKWLGLMEGVARSQHGPIKRRALYEIAVAQLRGRGKLDPAEWAIEQFFSDFAHESHPSSNDVEDATLLACYATSAVLRGEFSDARKMASAWADQARTAIDKALAGTNSDGSRYRLLLVRGHLDFDSAAAAETEDLRAVALLGYWEEATTIAERSPFADIDAVAALLETVVPVIGEHPRFRMLADRVDALVAARGGQAAGAEQGQRRALQYLKSDQLVLAVDQLQRAKEGWFSAETMRGSVLSMLLLGRAYLALNLPLAARYYAAAALHSVASSIGDELRPMAVRAAFLMADTYLHNGEGLSYMAAAGRAAELHLNHAPDPEELEKQPEFSAAIVKSAQVFAMITSAAPDLLKHANAILDEWQIDEVYAQGIREMSTKKPWVGMPVFKIEEMLREQSGQGLFVDVGPRVRFQWNALGINWSTEADASLRIDAERVAAALQICLVDLADVDLLIIPGDVHIQIERSGASHPSLSQQPDNGVLRFLITVPDAGDDADETALAMVMISTIVVQASAMPFVDYRKILEDKMKRGLTGRAFWVQPVGPLLRDARSLVLGDLPDLSSDDQPEIEVPPPLVHPELAWRDGDAPGYSPEKAKISLTNRYTTTAAVARVVAPLLMAHPASRKVLEDQHGRGLPDWQLINAIYNLVLNAAMEEDLGGPLLRGTPDPQGVMRRAIQRIESGDIPTIDIAKFTAESLQFHLDMGVMATLKSWGLQPHRPTPDIAATRRFLDARYRNSTDDIAHEDFFGWGAASDGSEPV